VKTRRNQPLPVLLGGVLTAGLLSGCGTQASAGGTGKAVIMGMSEEIRATDPASGYDPGSWLLFNNVFQSLMSFPKGSSTPQPEAAKECRFDTGSPTRYRCTLRSGLTFSNGDPLTSQDVKFSFDRVRKINDERGPGQLLASIKTVDAPDAKTVVFHLKFPDATFPSKIASGAGSIVDHREYKLDKLRTDSKAIGSGVYKLDSYTKKQAVFSVNSRYRGTAHVKNSGMTMELFHNDQKALGAALKKGDIDLAYRGLTTKDIETIQDSVKRNKNIEVIEGSSAEVQHLVFNMNAPVAGRLPVRKAIAYLINRNALVAHVYRSTAEPLYSIVPAGITSHNTAFFDMYGDKPKPDEAAQVLHTAGITSKVKLTLWSTPSRYEPATDEECRAIAQQLNASGLFDATVKSVPYGQYEKGIAAGKYGVYVKDWVPNYPDADNFTSPFVGKGNVLDNNYNNKTITNDLIPAESSATDRITASADFNELQDIVARDLPILPLWQGKQYAVAHNDITGLEGTLDASTVFRFWEISKH
jgi:peptide/nickel transport system substrate-binding protein